jgi:hypothetical protein
MKRKLEIFLDKHSLFGFIRIFLFPVTAIFSTVLRELQIIISLPLLIKEKWKYLTFSVRLRLIHLFYDTVAMNLSRFGNQGKSPTLGIGDFNLSKWFYYSKLSLIASWKGKPIIIPCTMLLLAMTHLIWTNEVNSQWVVLIIVLVLISTTFYYQTFGGQNYNAFGWLFFPLSLYGFMTENYLIATVSLSLSALFSITVAFINAIIVLIFAFLNKSILPLYAFSPAVVIQFINIIVTCNIKYVINSAINVLRAIGFWERKSKYKRIYTKGISIEFVYYFFLYGQFFIILILSSSRWLPLYGVAFLIFLINSLFFRFADIESMQMLIITISTAITIYSMDISYLPFLWLLLSPLPLVLFGLKSNALDIVPKRELISIKPLFQGITNLLKTLRAGEKILMVFNNPQGIYENLFDGYRNLIELISFTANENKILFFPNWFAVFETNYDGAPNFWGRDVESVKRNVKYWQVNYVIVYQTKRKTLDPKSEKAGFKCIDKFSWSDYKPQFHLEEITSKLLPD